MRFSSSCAVFRVAREDLLSGLFLLALAIHSRRSCIFADRFLARMVRNMNKNCEYSFFDLTICRRAFWRVSVVLLETGFSGFQHRCVCYGAKNYTKSGFCKAGCGIAAPTANFLILRCWKPCFQCLESKKLYKSRKGFCLIFRDSAGGRDIQAGTYADASVAPESNRKGKHHARRARPHSAGAKYKTVAVASIAER